MDNQPLYQALEASFASNTVLLSVSSILQLIRDQLKANPIVDESEALAVLQLLINSSRRFSNSSDNIQAVITIFVEHGIMFDIESLFSLSSKCGLKLSPSTFDENLREYVRHGQLQEADNMLKFIASKKLPLAPTLQQDIMIECLKQEKISSFRKGLQWYEQWYQNSNAPIIVQHAALMLYAKMKKECHLVKVLSKVQDSTECTDVIWTEFLAVAREGMTSEIGKQLIDMCCEGKKLSLSQMAKNTILDDGDDRDIVEELVRGVAMKQAEEESMMRMLDRTHGEEEEKQMTMIADKKPAADVASTREDGGAAGKRKRKEEVVVAVREKPKAKYVTIQEQSEELMRLVEKGNFQKVDEMLKQIPALIDTTSKNGESLLMLAVKGYRQSFMSKINTDMTIDVLLKYKADVNYSGTKRKESVLHVAVYYGQPNFVLKLLCHGADPTLKDSERRTPERLAQKRSERYTDFIDDDDNFEFIYQLLKAERERKRTVSSSNKSN